MGVKEVVALAAAIIAGLIAAIGVLWRALLKEREQVAQEREHSNSLQAQLNHEHKRDLRRVAGLPTSLDPPALPPPVIRDGPPKPPRPRKPAGK